MINIDEITDKLGLPIDPGIKYAVKCFNDAGFETSASCEGYFNVWGLPHPWVDFPEFESFAAMQHLIDKFYQDRNKPAYHIRIIKYVWCYRIQTSPHLKYDEIKDLPRDEAILNISRAEMNDFADFIILETDKRFSNDKKED